MSAREYAKQAPSFWTGETGREIKRRGSEATIVSLYLISSPHSNMIGLYYQPLLYMAEETGLGIEGASKGLQGCVEAGFCAYDDASKMVWVFEMAAYQIGRSLSPGDKRCKGIQKDYDRLPKCPFLGPFFDRYAEDFHLQEKRTVEVDLFTPIPRGLVSPLGGGSEAPSKPGAGAGAGAGAGKKRPSVSSVAEGPSTVIPCPYQAIVDLYHAELPTLPKVRLMPAGRQKALRRTWGWVLSSTKGDGSRRATNAEEAMAWLADYFRRASENDFLMGRTRRSPEHEHWRCDLDFLLTDKGMQHVIEKTGVAA